MTEFFCLMLLYCIVNIISKKNLPPLVAVLVLCVFVAVLLGYVIYRKNSKNISFKITAKSALAALPLLSFAFANILFLDIKGFSLSLVTLALAAISEELLFRGLLLTACEKYGRGTAVLVSTVLFSLYHLIGGNVIGALCAICFGFALSSYMMKYRALLPCIFAHLFVNITGEAKVTVPVLLTCCIISIICGCLFFRRVKEN